MEINGDVSSFSVKYSVNNIKIESKNPVYHIGNKVWKLLLCLFGIRRLKLRKHSVGKKKLLWNVNCDVLWVFTVLFKCRCMTFEIHTYSLYHFPFVISSLPVAMLF